MLQAGNGFTLLELYQLPTYLRQFYFKKLSDTKNKEQKEIKKAQKAAKGKTSKVRMKR